MATTTGRRSDLAATRRATGKLAAYEEKRDFRRTPEPSGRSRSRAPKGGHRFVVQRHRARRLHYDLRLEIGGVLVSWAVPKGPTLDPRARRLAVHVEDHPLDYFDFEGVIPEGYGDVIVWDWGTWEPAGGQDPEQALKAGELHFDLHGQKLQGRFVLIRTKTSGDKEQWLLLHKNDDAAVRGWDPEEHPESVKTGRTNDDVAAAKAKGRAKRGPRRTTASRRKTAPNRWEPPTDDELALDALGTKGEWEFGGRRLRLTNLDKVLFPPRPGEEPVTKRDLIRYHALIAPTMLPYLVDRPVNLHRYPNGADKPDDPELRPDRWTIRTVLDRVAEVGDPLAPLVGMDQELPSL